MKLGQCDVTVTVVLNRTIQTLRTHEIIEILNYLFLQKFITFEGLSDLRWIHTNQPQKHDFFDILASFSPIILLSKMGSLTFQLCMVQILCPVT